MSYGRVGSTPIVGTKSLLSLTGDFLFYPTSKVPKNLVSKRIVQANSRA